MENEFTFKFTQKEADLLIQVLAKQPYEISAKLISKMQLQFQGQQHKQALKEEPVKIENEESTES